MKKDNKYEDIQMIDLNDKAEDIVDIYIDRLYSTDKTVGVVVNKELAEYIMNYLLALDETSIKEIDLIDCMNTNEYLVSVDNDGYITVIPIESFIVLDNTDIVYIDMDGDIEQNIIDYCLNNDKEVILFGESDDYECDERKVDKDDIYTQLSNAHSRFSMWDEVSLCLMNSITALNDNIKSLNEVNHLLDELYKM